MTRKRKTFLSTATSVLDAIDSGAMLVDQSGAVVWVNARACEMFQQSPDQLIGRGVQELYRSGNSRQQVESILQYSDEPVESELRIRRADGGELPVRVVSRRLAGSASLAGHCVLTLENISSRELSAEKFHEQYSDLARLSDTAIEQAIALKHYSEKLEERVRERTADLHESNMDAIVMLAVACEARDADTGTHVRRIEHHAAAIARRLGLPATEAERIGYSSILHDVGKIHVPDRILRKPGTLTRGERAVMQTHTTVGEQILSKKGFFDVARQITRTHHENWDGSGYPDGLAGDGIPLSARIVRVADVFDALINERVYKPAWTTERALEHLDEERGRLFDANVVGAFLDLLADGEFDKSVDQR